MAAFATRFCLRHCVFLCKGTKLQKATLFALFGEAEFWDGLPVSAFASGNSCFISSRVQKLQNSAFAEFWDGLPVSAFASGNSCFISSRVQKLQNSAFAEFWDCTPVFALVCVFACGTGIFFRGFGLGRLERNGFLCAKASLDPLCYVSLFGTGNLYPNSA